MIAHVTTGRPRAGASSLDEHREAQRVAQEAGFSMIELLVSMLLLLALVAMIGRPVLDTFDSASGGQSNSGAQHTSSQALDTIRGDLLNAFAADRDPSKLRDGDDLRRALHAMPNTIESSDPADRGRVLDVRDVTVATANALTLRLDAVARDPGLECVAYAAATRQSDPKNFWVRRVVFADDRTCTGRLRDSYVIPPNPWTPRTPASAFQYQAVNASYGNCDARLLPAANAISANWITSVNVRLGVVESRGGAAADRAGESWIAIRSRESSSYRRALGCG